MPEKSDPKFKSTRHSRLPVVTAVDIDRIKIDSDFIKNEKFTYLVQRLYLGKITAAYTRLDSDEIVSGFHIRKEDKMS